MNLEGVQRIQHDYYRTSRRLFHLSDFADNSDLSPFLPAVSPPPPPIPPPTPSPGLSSCLSSRLTLAPRCN